MKTLYKTIVPCIMVCLVVGISLGQGREEIHKTFDAKEIVEISTVSGDCIVKAGGSDKIIVDVVYSVEPEDAFKPEFRERGNRLRLKERWYGRNTSGRVTWTLTVPPQTEIEFSTASGDLTVEGLTNSVEASTASGNVTVENTKGEFELSTASGDVSFEDTQGEFDISTASGEIEASNIQGSIEMSTASGDIDVSDSRGHFELSCASGSVDASKIVIEEESSFSTASGKVYVSVGKTPEYDLELSSASGNVILDYNGNPIKGYFEFTARKRRGRISSPISFDKEEEYERYDQTYVRKSFTRGGANPMVTISTASGRASLRK